jgi:hypothetical protein
LPLAAPQCWRIAAHLAFYSPRLGHARSFLSSKGKTGWLRLGAIQAAFPWRKYGVRPDAEQVMFVAGTP